MQHRLYGPTTETPRHELGDFARRVAVVAIILGLAAVVWYTAKVLLIAFAGALLAVFLDFLACQLSATVRIRRGWAFAIVAVGISSLLGLAGWIGLPHVADQISQLIRSLPQDLGQLQSYLSGREWGRTVMGFLPDMLASSNITSRLTTGAKDAFYGLAALAVIGVLGLYLGGNPGFYEKGVLRLFPGQRRNTAREVLSEVAYALRWWVLGQLVPMGVLGLATIIGLRLLHVRLAFTLGLFTGFMIFIPYIGSLIAYAVIALVTSVQGFSTVLYVTLMFVGIHVAEGYLLTPFVQRRAVYLPPALTIFGQVLLGALLGFVGLALATPLTAAAVVLVKMLYLREKPQHH